MKEKISIYDIPFMDMNHQMTTLSQYKGKLLLVIVGATHSAFTSQYTELEKIYRQYRNEGFEILDFPCDDFNGQCPGTIEEIDEEIRKEYETDFPRFDKVTMKDSPLFDFLSRKKKFSGFDKGNQLSSILSCIYIKQGPGWEKDPSVKWNFTKFLISRDGSVKKRFEPTCDMDIVRKSVEHYLDTEVREYES